MGCGKKVVDAVLFFFLVTLAVITPIFDAESVLPKEVLPKFLVDLKLTYGREFGDYLVLEKPAFFVGLTWFDILVVWPLSLLNLFAILASKSWFSKTSLIQGVAVFTSMIPILADMHLSGKANQNMQMVYYPFLAFSVLAILRGLLPCTPTPPPAKKKRV
ncbi:sigma intracellular receptor 2-like [Impatiens glandulifera]|uniref:sigma intracellular receptor 2-like n=1 Tax=Impatiens glandulifera TaxID=253017 RepID=UPI001FB19557|nr:sigma intracellular receptor 2-like [Impatiens glandulifera]